MRSFLHLQPINIRGMNSLELPEPIMDSEFAYDTTLYINGSFTSLWAVHKALSEFCEALRALLNWSKTVGLWVNNGLPPLWSPHQEFKWLSRGVDIPKDVQISHLLMTIRKKLMFWSSRNLSFAGRIVVANHVFLATIWYIASWASLLRRPWASLLRRRFIECAPSTGGMCSQSILWMFVLHYKLKVIGKQRYPFSTGILRV